MVSIVSGCSIMAKMTKEWEKIDDTLTTDHYAVVVL